MLARVYPILDARAYAIGIGDLADQKRSICPEDERFPKREGMRNPALEADIAGNALLVASRGTTPAMGP